MQPFKHSVLLVDDEVIISTQIEEVLRAEGYRVIGIETSGQDAIDAAKTLTPDIVVMDIMMPGPVDGIAAARKIMDGMNIPVLFLTAYADERLLQRTKPLDPFGYVLKPVQDKQLIVAIELALYKKKMEDRLLETYQQLTAANQKLTQEIEDHQKARQALQRNEARYRTLLENIPDVVYSFGPGGRIHTVNPGIKEHYGYAASDVIGSELISFIHPADRKRIIRHFLKALAAKQPYARGVQFRILNKNGKVHWVERNAHLSFDRQDNFVQEEGVLRDITAHRQLQNQLVRTERLSATGQLAASIAYEINSPLQATSLMLDRLRSRCRRDRKLAPSVELISDAFDSIKYTVKRLIDLNRPSQAVRQLTQINAILTDTVQLTKFRLQQHKIDIDLHLSPSLPMVTVAPQDISHAILALINNAIEAIEAGPMPARPVSVNPATHKITITTASSATHLFIRVEDTGPGIRASDLQRIFDPFFTRKKPMGIGVGLSVCNSVVKEHGGVLSAANTSGGGARFTIEIPLRT